jgi:hypothetical protein
MSQSQTLSAAPLADAASPELLPRLMRVAWMGVLLGLVLEVLLLLCSAWRASCHRWSPWLPTPCRR